MKYRRLLPPPLRVAAAALRQDVRNVVRALTDQRSRGVRVEYQGIEVELDVSFESSSESEPAPLSVEEAIPNEALATLVFSESGVSIEVVDPDTTILAAGLAAGVDLLYSCTLGGCAACMVDIAEGAVDYKDPEAICLLDEEVEDGEVCLACVARPRGRVVIEA